MELAISLLVRRRELGRCSSGYHNPPHHYLGKMEVALILVGSSYLYAISKLQMGRIDRRIPRPRAGRDTRRGGGMHSIDPAPDDHVAYIGANRSWLESEIHDSNPDRGCRRR